MTLSKAIFIRISPDLKRRLEELATKERRTRSDMGRILIEDGLDARNRRDKLTAVAPRPELRGILGRLVDTRESYTTGGDSET